MQGLGGQGFPGFLVLIRFFLFAGFEGLGIRV